MFRIIRFRRLKKPPTTPSPEQPPADEPPAAGYPPMELALKVKVPEAVAVTSFRVGNYEVGAGFCPHLYGHPGIRY